jgi:hypothetical protein
MTDEKPKADEEPIRDVKNLPPQAQQVTQPPVAKVGDTGQPSVADWEKQIEDDIALALGKIAQIPAGLSPRMERLARTIRAHLG